MNTRALVNWLAICLLVVLLGGCALLQRPPSQPGLTKLSAPLVVLPAKTIGGYLVVEVPLKGEEPLHFLVDTGSSLTLVSPEYAERFGSKSRFPGSQKPIRVKSARGDSAVLESTSLPLLQLGGVRFEDVTVAIYDTAALSAHLEVKIDGILGFPLFRHTRLTLDYPHSRIVLAPVDSVARIPGNPIPYTTRHRAPVIPVQIGDQTVEVLVDSGSDVAVNLNTEGISVSYTQPPRPISYVGTLTGDHALLVTRLNQTLNIAGQSFPTPIVHLTDELSSLGGEVLRHFSITFDQTKQQISFQRDSRRPVQQPPLRGTGLKFRKTPAYWRVINIVPNSPANDAQLDTAALVSRINGEPVAAWDFLRYEQLITEATEITYTLLHGTIETSITLPVADLVP